MLSDHPLRHDPSIQARIFERLIEKASIRNLTVDAEAMSNPEIRWRSEAEYTKLAPEIEGDLPPFAEVYAVVAGFYRSVALVRAWHRIIGRRLMSFSEDDCTNLLERTPSVHETPDQPMLRSDLHYPRLCSILLCAET